MKFAMSCCSILTIKFLLLQIECATNNAAKDDSGHENMNLLDSNICGVKLSDRIINGNKTEPFEFPWVVIIQYGTSNGIEPLCGGSIISKRYVLTAAHCIAYIRGDPTIHSVIVGEHNTLTDPDCDSDGYCADSPKTILVESSTAHPQYSHRRKSNDIGLLRLVEDVDFSGESVRPICLPVTAELKNTELTKMLIAGWGRTELGSRSSALLQATIPVVSDSDCKAKLAKIVDVRAVDSSICAGGDGSDSCNGDSGGPAIYPVFAAGTARFVQFGIVSSGLSGCNVSTSIPSLYTRIPLYMQWILDTMY